MTEHPNDQPRDTRWRESALCAQTDPEMFFPYPGQNATEAKDICGRCPVRIACLADAIGSRERFGIRGGMTPVERAALARSTAQSERASQRWAS